MNPGLRSPGRWFYTRKGKTLSSLAAILSLIITTFGILAGEYLVDFQSWLPKFPEIVSNGFIPLFIWATVLFGLSWVIKKKFDAKRSEMQLWIFTFLVVAYLVLMFTGIFFRGEAMTLTLSF